MSTKIVNSGVKSPCLAPERWKIVYLGLVVMPLAALALLYLAPITDIDLWWHLATGRHLVETGAFLSADPFGLAGAQISPGREVILNGYWLSQVIFYGLYQWCGLAGMIVLRLLLLFLPPLAVLLYGWRCSPRSAFVLPLVFLCGWSMVDVAGIRPNHLTVAFVPLLMILLASIGYAADDSDLRYNLRRAWLLPLFILIWANLHGGFLLGVVIVMLYAVGETATQLMKRRPLHSTTTLWGIVGATIAASLITPNGLLNYSIFFSFQSVGLQQVTSEYLSPLFLATNGILIYWPFFILLTLILLLILHRRSQLVSTRGLLLVTLAVIGLSAFRYAPLFVGAAAILLMPELQAFKEKKLWTQMANVTAVVLGGVIVMLAIVSYPQKGGALVRGMADTAKFPVTATDFLEQENYYTGVAFNHFNWGGYLAWREAGRITTFIDGRSLNLPLFHAYTRALWLPAETKSIFDQHGVDIIIMPRLNPFTGELYALTDFLWRSPRWNLIYRDATAMILVKDLQRSGESSKTALDKNLIYKDVLTDVATFSAASGRNANLEKAAQMAAFRLKYGSH